MRSDIGVVKHSVLLSNSPGIDGYSLTIHNMVDVSSETNKVSAYMLIIEYALAHVMAVIHYSRKLL